MLIAIKKKKKEQRLVDCEFELWGVMSKAALLQLNP